MRLIKVVLAGAAIGVILAAFRDFENRRWLAVPYRGGGAPGAAGEAEPVLGYDGMDQDTLIEWLGDADLDRATLQRMRRYEQVNMGREPVLAAISDLI